jgi:hypothetical protein
MTTEITVEQLRGADQRHRDAWCGWAVANGLDPNRISGQHAITVVGDVIHCRMFATALNGRRIARDDVDELATEAVTAPLLVPMPEAWPEP